MPHPHPTFSKIAISPHRTTLEPESALVLPSFLVKIDLVQSIKVRTIQIRDNSINTFKIAKTKRIDAPGKQDQSNVKKKKLRQKVEEATISKLQSYYNVHL